MRQVNDLIRTSAIGFADAIVLIRLRPDWSRLTTGMRHPHVWIARVGSERAAATSVSALIWCLGIWLAVGLVFALLSAAPGRPGHFARQLAGRLLPAALVRVMVGAAGLSVLLAPVSATAATSSTSGPSHVTAPAPSWPTSAPSASPTNSPTTSPTVPVTTGPTSTSAPPQTAPPQTAPPQTAPPQTAPPQTPTLPTTTTGATTSGPADVVVGVGDSLWTITARHLGAAATPAQIAAQWPSWYQANREVIGADPGLLHPGEVLTDPGPR